MLLIDNHFDEYVKECERVSLHKNITYDDFPEKINELKNVIFYGPSGVGKYTQMLKCIKRYSPSELKYEKRITITFNKSDYIFKISDIHFEVDVQLLGCNSKLLWNEIYTNIVDIILARPDSKVGIIVVKNFHNINNDLLETFYSYMQKVKNIIDIKFILLTEALGFLPNNIYNCCKLIRIPRPSRKSYNTIVKVATDIELDNISNIKNLLFVESTHNFNKPICKKILDSILNLEGLDLKEFRNDIYNLFIYNLDVYQCLWYILFDLISNHKIKEEDMGGVYIELIKFLQQYNNNYRPIYHLENYLLYLVTKIYGF